MGTPMTQRVRWLLVGSLALNLLVVGAVAGALMTGPRHLAPHGEVGGRSDGRHDPRLRAMGNVPYVMALGPEDRRALLKQVVGGRGALRANRERLRERFEQTLTALRADPYDPETLGRLLGAQRETLFERQRLGEALLLERIAAMDAEERAAYAGRLDMSLRRGSRGRD